MKTQAFHKTALALAAVLISFGALAAAREVTIFNAVSAASGSYADALGNPAERTAGYPIVRFQVCGAGFTGTVTAKQGAKNNKLVASKALTIAGLTGCDAAYYIKLPSAAWTGFDYTRAAGTVTVYMELAP